MIEKYSFINEGKDVNIFCIFAALTWFASSAFSQSVDWKNIHDLTVRGIDQLYNLEMEPAERTFDEVISLAPKDPRGYFFKGMIYFWTYSLNKDEKAFNHFFELSESVIDICEHELEKDEHDATATFYLGGIYGYRGLAYHRNGSLMKAAVDGRKGYFYLKDAASLKSDLYDAQMGFGLFSYLIGKLPKSSRWLLNILGFEGDKEGGLAALKVAAEKGTYTRSEAAFFLSQFLNVESRPVEARTYLKQLLHKYPGNTLFLVTFAQWELRQDRVDTAIAAAQKAISINSRTQIRIGDEFAHGVLANCYFVKNEFKSAVEHGELYLQMAADKEIISNSFFYRLGVSYEFLGDREKALVTYKRMKKVSSDNQWNYQFYRRGLARIQKPLSEADQLLIKADNEASLNMYEKAEPLYREVLADKSGDDQRALALYGLAQLYSKKQQYGEAVDAAKQLIVLHPREETWLVPHGYYQLGLAYVKLGQTSDARKAFEAVEHYSEYDYETRLKSRVEQEIEKLNAVN